jgi:hypothetical protein
MENLLKNVASFFNWNLGVPAEYLGGILHPAAGGGIRMDLFWSH